MAKEFKLDLSKFKKIKSDKASTTLRHEDGHELKVAHSALSPKVRAQMHELPTMLAEGGDVADGPTTDQVEQAAQQPQTAAPITINVGAPSGAAPVAPTMPQAAPQPFTQLPGVPNINAAPEAPESKDIPQEKDDSAAPQAAAPAAQPAAPQATPPAATTPTQPSDPYGNEAYYNAYGKGISEQKAGLQGAANAQGAASTADAAALQKTIQTQQEQAKGYQDQINELTQEQKSVINDYKAGHIDPNRLMNSKNTFQRVTSGIGLILGGIGAGLTGGPNQALEYLKHQINNDIEAQKAEMGKNENLLAANFKQFGNLKDAVDMSRAMQTGILADQIRMNGAKSGSALAKANALQAAGKLDQESAQTLSQIAMRRTLLSGMNQGSVPPEHVVRMIVPQGEQAAAYKELGEARNLQAVKDNTLAAFDQIAKLNTVGGRLGSPIQSTRQINALRGAALDKLTKDTSGRVTPETVKLIGSAFDTLGADPKTMEVQKQTINNLLSQNMHFPLLNAYGINTQNLGRTTAAGQPRIQESAPVIK
jgi:hypothetical protein